MEGFIYKITNKVNNKVYIGQTRYTVEFRWRQHQHKQDNCYFHNAIRKWGVDNFTVEILEKCDVDLLDSREIFYIAKYDSYKSGYNSTLGEEGNKKIMFTDSQYEEIEGLYKAGFSNNKIATLFKVDKSTIVKILTQLGVKLRTNKLKINHQEFLEIVKDYKSGHSLKSLAKRYDCDGKTLKEFLKRKGVNIKDRYSILKDWEAQKNLIDDYLDGRLKLTEIQTKYHCSYNTLLKILSINGISKGKKHFKMNADECLAAIKMFNEGKKISAIAKRFGVDKSTIYSLFRRYHINYLTV